MKNNKGKRIKKDQRYMYTNKMYNSWWKLVLKQNKVGS